MSKINLAFASYISQDELQLLSLIDKFKDKKNKENYCLKVHYNKDSNGSMNIAVYANDKLVYKSLENYRRDDSNHRYERSCKKNYCKTTMEYDLLGSNKIRVEKGYYNDPNYFELKLSFNDKNGNYVREYKMELSYDEIGMDDNGYYSFLIHNAYNTTTI